MLLATSAFRRGPSNVCVATALRQRPSLRFFSAAPTSGDDHDDEVDGNDSTPADVDETTNTTTDNDITPSISPEVEDTPSTDTQKPEWLTTISLRPTEVVTELNRHIVGQASAKRAVAIAMRNRWRRRQLPPALLKEVTPRNVLMIGPTGCGVSSIIFVHIICKRQLTLILLLLIENRSGTTYGKT